MTVSLIVHVIEYPKRNAEMKILVRLNLNLHQNFLSVFAIICKYFYTKPYSPYHNKFQIKILYKLTWNLCFIFGPKRAAYNISLYLYIIIQSRRSIFQEKGRGRETKIPDEQDQREQTKDHWRTWERRCRACSNARRWRRIRRTWDGHFSCKNNLFFFCFFFLMGKDRKKSNKMETFCITLTTFF